jgi:type I restriction enzyme S subunit
MRSEVSAMALSKLGEFIELVDERNSNNHFKANDLRGISINKLLVATKADTTNLNLSGYKVVKHNWFTYCTVTSRNGNKISIAYNDGEDCIVSSINPVFKVKDETRLLSRYLMMFFNRTEFDRYSRFNSWGSARETFSWEDMCDIELDIPPIEIQRKYVAIYEGLLANLRSYEKGLDDLKLVCDGYIEDLRRKEKLYRVGDYITFRNEKNSNNQLHLEQGINISKQFISPQRGNSNLSGRKIVRKGDIAYCSQLNNENVAIAYRTGEDCVVSSVYEAFYINNKTILNPRYLFLWLCRSEFGRYVYWKSTGTSYEFLDSVNIKELLIPIPKIERQNNIVEVFDCMEKRKSYIDILKEKIANICPILIRGSIIEAQGGQ